MKLLVFCLAANAAASDVYFAADSTTPTCVISGGHTVIKYDGPLHPSFHCSHNADSSACSCTATHPTHHEGGCMSLSHGPCDCDLTAADCDCVHTIGGTCTAAGLNFCTNADITCQNGGTPNGKLTACGCTCAPGYTGDHCETDIDECANNSQCLNGATCVDAVNGFTCDCAAGYSGTYCGTNIDECASSPCLNNGVCVDDINGFTCDCSAVDYHGATCETHTDDCANQNCSGNGTCVDGVNTYSCTCDAGYTGDHCETDINECADVDCGNGSCNDLVNAYSCTCDDGYTGDHCETDIDDCANNSQCLNNGVCVDAVNGFTCDCSAVDYHGDRCQTHTDDCANQNCSGNGTCVDGVNAYSCTCDDGYTGEHCETDIDECANNSQCLNGATCVDEVNGFSCTCATGYFGTDCRHADKSVAPYSKATDATPDLCIADAGDVYTLWANGHPEGTAGDGQACISNVATASECAQRCTQDDDCTSFWWTREYSNGRCCTKKDYIPTSTVTTKDADEHATHGFYVRKTWTVGANTYKLWGNGHPATHTGAGACESNVASQVACAELCNARSGCTGFWYTKEYSNGRCCPKATYDADLEKMVHEHNADENEAHGFFVLDDGSGVSGCPAKCTWIKVTPNMITQTIADGTVTTITPDGQGGTAISVNANQGGCGNGNGSGATHIISGDWRKIRYTEHFDGTTACWSIFGSCGYLYDAQCPNLIRLSPEDGDTITDIVDLEDVHLGGSKTQRCDNQADNFWHGASGSAGDASARVTLRRDDMTADAGLATGTSCTVTSSTYWHYTDIEVCL